MSPGILLGVLEKHIKTILGELENEDKNRLTDLLRKIMVAEREYALQDAKNFLYEFCLGNPFLRKTILEAEARKQRPIVFRGKPIPKSMTKETKRIRLQANRLIDAIEQSDNTEVESKNEK